MLYDKMIRVLKNPGLIVHRLGLASHQAIVERSRFVHIDDGVVIGYYALVISDREHQVKIGSGTLISPFSVIIGGYGVTIGRDVMIGHHSTIVAGNHDYRRLDLPMIQGGTFGRPIVIEDNVWIGANCVITDGVTIGRGAVVGAGSVVTHDVGAYDVVAGVPAHIIKNRLVNSGD